MTGCGPAWSAGPAGPPGTRGPPRLPRRAPGGTRRGSRFPRLQALVKLPLPDQLTHAGCRQWTLIRAAEGVDELAERVLAHEEPHRVLGAHLLERELLGQRQRAGETHLERLAAPAEPERWRVLFL